MPSKSFPKVWIGYGLASSLFIVEFVLGSLQRTDGKMVFLFVLPLLIAAIVYWCFCVFRVHEILGEVSSGQYPITPGQAVGFQFIPLYNWYWFFKWTGELANTVNHLLGAKKITPWIPGLALSLSAVVARIVDPGMGLFVSFAVADYLARNLKAAIQGMELPIQDYAVKCPSGGRVKTPVAVIILLGVILLAILAAIAIPNLIRARERTKQKEQSAWLAAPAYAEEAPLMSEEGQKQAAALIDKAGALIKQGNYGEAGKTIDEWERVSPGDPSIPLWRDLVAKLEKEPDPKRREELYAQFLNNQLAGLIDTLDTANQGLDQLNQKLEKLGPQNSEEELSNGMAKESKVKGAKE